MKQKASKRRAFSSLLLAACILIGAAEMGIYIRAHPQLSFVDEVQHYDYLAKASRGQFVRRGELLERDSMRLLACRGLDIDAAEYDRFYGQPEDLPACDSEIFEPSRFPELGVNHTSVHPPVYYIVTGVLARVIRAVTPVRSLLTAARLANGFWLALSLILLWLLLAELGVSPIHRLFPALLLATAPPVVEVFGAVGTDAASFAAGAGVVLATIRWERGRSRTATLLLAALLAVAVKETDVLAVGLALAYLLFRWFQRAPGSRRRLVVGGAVMIAAVATVGSIWLAVESRNADLATEEIPLIARFHQDSITLDDVASQYRATVTPVRNVLPPKFLRTDATAVHGRLLDWSLLGCILVVPALVGFGSRPAGLAGAALVTMILGGPVLVVANHVLLGIFVQIPQRYGFSLVPVLVALAGSLAERWWLELMLAALAAFGLIAVVQASLSVL